MKANIQYEQVLYITDINNMEDHGSVSAKTITWKDIEQAQIQIMKEAYRLRYKDDSKFINEYAGYILSLRQAEDPDKYIKAIATMLFPNEDEYNIRMNRYRKWYKNKKELLARVENLYRLYYELSKEDKPMTDNEIDYAIEKKLKNMEV